MKVARYLRWVPSLLLFWAAGLVQGIAVADTTVPVTIASTIATACFVLAAWVAPRR